MKLAYREWTGKAAKELGWASSLVIQHGLLGNKNNWAVLCDKKTRHPQLGELCRSCYSLDMRNHGESPHSEDHSLEAMADDLDLFIKTKVKETALTDHPEDVKADPDSIHNAELHGSVVIAHSMGGMALMHDLVRRTKKDYGDNLWGPSGLIRGAVVVDTTPMPRAQPQFRVLQKYLDALSNIPLKEIQTQSEADKLLQDAVPDTALRQFLLTNLRFKPSKDDPKRKEAEWIANLPVLSGSLEQLVFPHNPEEMEGKKCDIPVLFVFGENSEYNKPEAKAMIPKFFSHVVDQVSIPEAGHFVHHEQKDKFLEAVVPFCVSRMLEKGEK